MFELIAAIYFCWQAPTENVDGSPISGIKEYKAYYGETSGQYDYQKSIDPNHSCTNVRTSRGTWYLVMTAIDLENDESGFSNEVELESTTLQDLRGGRRLTGPSGGRVITN